MLLKHHYILKPINSSCFDVQEPFPTEQYLQISENSNNNNDDNKYYYYYYYSIILIITINAI